MDSDEDIYNQVMSQLLKNKHIKFSRAYESTHFF